ncbi:carboxypeptidase M32 [Alphaproteobacteria bacterium KMM 3653]|uniref:Metal-dependent carboxypeptidase n=1 Tax=Harenicola maris TaxID=2841044 RepID=A0AAP2CPB3_9RHOB|nr:carboxypeptidase M32 [Harenicola maris]
MSSYSDLMDFTRETAALSLILDRLGWDMETTMPKGAAGQRSEEIAALEGVIHARRADARVGDWLAGAENDPEADPAQLREIKRSFERATKVPGDLAAEIARSVALAHNVWAEARASEDFAGFAPTLERIFDLRRQEATALTSGDLYDALLNDYEPGATGQSIAAMFDALRGPTVDLIDRIKGADQPKALSGHWDAEKQMEFSAKLAEVFTYDMSHGRIDRAVHPFSSGSGKDVRITTRTDEAAPLDCFYSTVHEVGHAVYEQNVRDDLGLTALGRGVSLGIHESQSRMFENQLGRSRAFCSWLGPQMAEAFGHDLGDADAFYGAVNRVTPGFIRTEADELHYNLHVMLRFDLERALLRGDLAVTDLPEAWNTRFKADFGAEVPSPSKGCLQDVHWSFGLIGYFPTYTLGNVYAGCLHEALRADLPDLDADLAAGQPAPAIDWLKERVHQHGASRLPAQIIRDATGAAPTEAPLLAYLNTKFSGIYNL